MGTVKIPEDGRVYLDTNCIIYFVEHIVPYVELITPVWDAARRNAITIVTSEVTILEVLVRPIRERMALVEKAFRQVLFESREVHLIPATAAIFERAAILRAEFGIKTVDAIHAATALDVGVKSFLTNDAAFSRVIDLPTIILSELVGAK